MFTMTRFAKDIAWLEMVSKASKANKCEFLKYDLKNKIPPTFGIQNG